ncbi:MAG: hypothetical protein ABEH64_05645, partial [Salinirussus sp.]
MSDTINRLGGVNNEAVWRVTKQAFLASALIFLVTILLGFLNILTTGQLPRWQVLVHLHSGTLGWITLSMIGAAVWLFAADRSPSSAYAGRVKWVVWLSILAFIGLIASFGLASDAIGLRVLLGIIGPIAALVVWAAAVVIVLELRAMTGSSSAQWLMATGLVAAGIATTMGALMAMAVSGVLPFPPELAIFGHVIAIEGYLFLIGAATIEWLVIGADTTNRSRPALFQALLGIVIALLGPAIIVMALMGVPQATLGMIANLGLLSLIVLYGLVFLIRVGPTALTRSPLDGGPKAWGFFSALWLAIAALMWPARLALGNPEWWILAYAHILFVGLLTNAILGVLAARTADAPPRYEWAEPVGM